MANAESTHSVTLRQSNPTLLIAISLPHYYTQWRTERGGHIAYCMSKKSCPFSLVSILWELDITSWTYRYIFLLHYYTQWRTEKGGLWYFVCPRSLVHFHIMSILWNTYPHYTFRGGCMLSLARGGHLAPWLSLSFGSLAVPVILLPGRTCHLAPWLSLSFGSLTVPVFWLPGCPCHVYCHL